MTSYVYDGTHAYFKGPENPDSVIWRYMNFAKFAAMLDGKCLNFARADKLGDNWEGAITKPMKVKREEALAAVNESKETANTMALWSRATLTQIAVNCWTLNESESALMWNSYVSGYEGVCVSSTFAKLTSAFPKWDGTAKPENDHSESREYRIWIGKVGYYNYERDIYENFGPYGDNPLKRIISKRLVFSEEREVRAVIYLFTSDLEEHGVAVPVELGKLIDEVRVHPRASPWFLELVKSTCARNGFRFPVTHSPIGHPPVF